MILKPMRAVILAGGRGTRLYPYTAVLPKPLVPLGEVPIVEILMRQLLHQGIQDITLTLGHNAQLIRAYFAQHRLNNKLALTFVEEETPTGTAGSLANVPNLNETFLVMNGDLLTDINFWGLIDFHKQSGAILTIASYQRQVKVDLGVLKTDPSGQVIDYIEKPEFTYQVSMGIYVYEPQVLHYIQPNEYLDFPNLVLGLLQNNEKVQTFPWHGLWLDIGRPDDYARAQEIFAQNHQNFGFASSD